LSFLGLEDTVAVDPMVEGGEGDLVEDIAEAKGVVVEVVMVEEDMAKEVMVEVEEDTVAEEDIVVGVELADMGETLEEEENLKILDKT